MLLFLLFYIYPRIELGPEGTETGRVGPEFGLPRKLSIRRGLTKEFSPPWNLPRNSQFPIETWD